MEDLSIESAEERRWRTEWVAKYGTHPRVLRWLQRNPPPAEWRGTPADWAYLEMASPIDGLLGRLCDMLGI